MKAYLPLNCIIIVHDHKPFYLKNVKTNTSMLS